MGTGVKWGLSRRMRFEEVSCEVVILVGISEGNSCSCGCNII